MKKLLGAFILLLVAVPAALYFLSTGTVIHVDSLPRIVGPDTPIVVRFDNPHGLRRVLIKLEPCCVVSEQHAAPSRLLFWRSKQPSRVVRVTPGKGVRDGKAKLVIEAQSNDLRATTDTFTQDVEVITQPPRVVADGFQHYINQGGAELVTFRPSGYWTEAGVRVGKYTFRSFPLPGSTQQERFSLFVYPWDVSPDTVPVVFARNPAGTESTARFWHKVFPKRFRSRDLDINDDFMQKVASQIDPSGTGDLLSRFLKINGDLRRRNNQALADLRTKTEERFLWTGPFLQLTNSKVESQFADRRSYVYQGKKVDEQVHLGFDLSVTQHVGVTAANDGKVVHAADLGIYGNCVVIDHGYGLQSIYGHLSSIDVKPGDMVKKSQVIGKSGSTGLAGGDHLHFSMQIDGVQVNPVEWWDDHWIQDRIRSKVPLGSGATAAPR